MSSTQAPWLPNTAHECRPATSVRCQACYQGFATIDRPVHSARYQSNYTQLRPVAGLVLGSVSRTAVQYSAGLRPHTTGHTGPLPCATHLCRTATSSALASLATTFRRALQEPTPQEAPLRTRVTARQRVWQEHRPAPVRHRERPQAHAQGAPRGRRTRMAVGTAVAHPAAGRRRAAGARHAPSQWSPRRTCCWSGTRPTPEAVTQARAATSHHDAAAATAQVAPAASSRPRPQRT